MSHARVLTWSLAFFATLLLAVVVRLALGDDATIRVSDAPFSPPAETPDGRPDQDRAPVEARPVPTRLTDPLADDGSETADGSSVEKTIATPRELAFFEEQRSRAVLFLTQLQARVAEASNAEEMNAALESLLMQELLMAKYGAAAAMIRQGRFERSTLDVSGDPDRDLFCLQGSGFKLCCVLERDEHPGVFAARARALDAMDANWQRQADEFNRMPLERRRTLIAQDRRAREELRTLRARSFHALSDAERERLHELTEQCLLGVLQARGDEVVVSPRIRAMYEK